MAEPLVSVLMITYNQAAFIARAIEGVLQQKTGFSYELVIGEDHSTDGTRDIVMRYQKMHPDIIHVVTSEKNVGTFNNSDRATKACRGKYLSLCEGDDYWHHAQKLQKQVEYMERNPECGLVHSDYDRYYATSGKTIHGFNRTMKNTPPDPLDMPSILRGGRYLYILTCTVTVRRNMFIEVVNADPYLYKCGNFSIGDTPIWAEIAWRSKIHYIDESLATYTVQPNSAARNSDPVRRMQFGKSNCELFLYLVQKYGLPDSEYDYHMTRWCAYAMQIAFVRRDEDLAREARKKKEYWSPKEHLLYYGTMNRHVNRSMKGIIRLKNRVMQRARHEKPV